MTAVVSPFKGWATRAVTCKILTNNYELHVPPML